MPKKIKRSEPMSQYHFWLTGGNIGQIPGNFPGDIHLCEIQSNEEFHSEEFLQREGLMAAEETRKTEYLDKKMLACIKHILVDGEEPRFICVYYFPSY